jgi:hypothetical protein
MMFIGDAKMTPEKTAQLAMQGRARLLACGILMFLELVLNVLAVAIGLTAIVFKATVPVIVVFMITWLYVWFTHNVRMRLILEISFPEFFE